jgi:uncharacterized protein YlxW (UPF0749 family)
MATKGAHVRRHSPALVLALFIFTGFVFVTASISADGDDLRPAGGDIASLLRDRANRVEEQRLEASALRSDVDALSLGDTSEEVDKLRKRVEELERTAGLKAVEGPGIRVTLTDAPKSEQDQEIDQNILIVHQQDIQAYVNALWAGGAEAISLQGQRITSTTGIVCVGSSVLLDDVPYFPPYVIEAVGNPTTMRSSLDTAPDTRTYAQYAEAYNLGLEIEMLPEVKVKEYANPVSLTYASVPEN